MDPTGDNPTRDPVAHGYQEAYQDGNALAGPLAEIFAVDVTAAVSRCAHCRSEGPVAGLRVYGRATALVARCPHCDGVVLRLVRAPDTAWLDMSGSLALAVPLGRA
ncbi:hypothetical protein GA0115240_13973 [Streptomyces sp. DvalAA-14]|uniref:DUF6510 family protein n=1 Tax=unclassified Streptomyces TaxID=2593676 RepID=UPI00081B5BA6|nr:MULTISPECIES: DUF6510 family protein [unclassified Streptomyces]MYS22289.1 hypothetical protein [Streptomyces sp. SID4948]SCE12987.1 hypothetical protein GA0115240_13973 [Streptomyces sp. DvalAA-14]